jgi:hypothetical protein
MPHCAYPIRGPRTSVHSICIIVLFWDTGRHWIIRRLASAPVHDAVTLSGRPSNGMWDSSKWDTPIRRCCIQLTAFNLGVVMFNYRIRGMVL